MKNLHFYAQSTLLLIALCIAVQIPFQHQLMGYVVLVEFVLGIYQFGMGFLLKLKLSQPSLLLEIYFFGSLGYVIMLISLALLDFGWMDQVWIYALFIFPWIIAIYFLVVLDDLERKRGYRV